MLDEEYPGPGRAEPTPNRPRYVNIDEASPVAVQPRHTREPSDQKQETGRKRNAARPPPVSPGTPVTKVVACYDYDAKCADDLSFKRGEKIPVSLLVSARARLMMA